MTRPTPPRPLKRLLTPPEVAEILGVTIGTLKHWAYKGRGPRYVKVGSLRRYHEHDVAAWIASLDEPKRKR